jgi:hypothetical protein
VRRRRNFDIVDYNKYSELKVNIIVCPEAKVIIVIRPEAEIFEPGCGIRSFACPLTIHPIFMIGFE